MTTETEAAMAVERPAAWWFIEVSAGRPCSRCGYSLLRGNKAVGGPGETPSRPVHYDPPCAEAGWRVDPWPVPPDDDAPDAAATDSSNVAKNS